MTTTQRRCNCGGVRESRAAQCVKCRKFRGNDQRWREIAERYGVSRKVVHRAGTYDQLMALDEDVRRLLLGVGAQCN